MNRLEWVLGIVLVVLLVVVVALSLIFWFRPDSQEGPAANSATLIAQRADIIAPTSVYEGRSAQFAFATAQSEATSWYDDAILLSASATWPQGASIQEITRGETTWRYSFYSPSADKIARISVIEDTATLIQEGDHTQENPVLNVSGWNLDSQEVIQILLREGGQEFIQNQGVTTLTMTLFTDDKEQNGRIEWLLGLISLKNNHSITMRIDATSGEILETIIAP